MKFFLNTVYIEEVRKIKELQIIDGINTNLAGMEALGVKDINQILTHYNVICQTFNKTVLVDVKAKDYSSILREVDILTSVNELITVKIPANLDGIKAINTLANQKFDIVCSSIFSTSQAILAAEAGALYIFIPMKKAMQFGIDALHLLTQIINIYNEQGYDTYIIADGISSSIELTQMALLGADGISCDIQTIYSFFQNNFSNNKM